MVSCQQTFPSSEKTKYMIFTHSEDRINFKELNIVLNYNEPGRNNPDLIKARFRQLKKLRALYQIPWSPLRPQT